MQMINNHVYDMCFFLFVYDNIVYVLCRFRPVGAVGLGPCLVLRCCIFLPAVGDECHTGLLPWLCRHPKFSTVWLAAAGVL